MRKPPESDGLPSLLKTLRSVHTKARNRKPSQIGRLSHGAHLPHLQQLSLRLPNPQLLHKNAGIFVLPHHLPQTQQLSLRLPNPQSLHSRAGIFVEPHHLPHLQQLSLRLPNPQLLHKYAE